MHSGWRMKPDSKLRHKPEKTINSMLKIFKEKLNFYIIFCIIGFTFYALVLVYFRLMNINE